MRSPRRAEREGAAHRLRRDPGRRLAATTAGDFDFVVCSAYKWLMCPRGVAFLTVRPQPPRGDRPGGRRLVRRRGRPLELLRAAAAPRRPTPAAWTPRRRGSRGSEPSRLSSCSRRSASTPIHAHDVGLANDFRAGLGLPPATRRSSASTARRRGGPRSAPGSRRPSAAVGFACSWHLYNTERDVEIALDALA